jgi:hypothetical protein
MRTPFGRVRLVSVLLILAILGAIVAGLIVPGNTGTTIEVVAWFAFFALVLIEVGPGTVGLRTRYARDRDDLDEEDPKGAIEDPPNIRRIGWPFR